MRPALFVLIFFLCVMVLECSGTSSSDAAILGASQEQNAGDTTTTTTAAEAKADGEDPQPSTNKADTTTSTAAPENPEAIPEANSTPVSSSSSTSSTGTSSLTETSSPNHAGSHSSTSQQEPADIRSSDTSRNADRTGERGGSNGNTEEMTGSVPNTEVNAKGGKLTTVPGSTSPEPGATGSRESSKPSQSSSGQTSQDTDVETTHSHASTQNSIAVSQQKPTDDAALIAPDPLIQPEKTTAPQATGNALKTPQIALHKATPEVSPVNSEMKRDTKIITEDHTTTGITHGEQTPMVLSPGPENNVSSSTETGTAKHITSTVDTKKTSTPLPTVSNALPPHNSVDKTDGSLGSSSLFALAALATLAVAAAAPAH